jgi:chromosome partitioning protein
MLCIGAYKGGVGKTTVAVNMAASLAVRHRVLLVDLDPQAGLAAGLGVDAEGPGTYEVLHGADITAAAVPTAIDGLELVSATLDLAGAAVELLSTHGWQHRLRDALRSATEDFDWGVVDTPPGLGVLTQLALVACDAVVAPCSPDFMAARSLPLLFDTITHARAVQPHLELAGIVPTMVGTRTLHEREVLELLHDRHGELLLPAIPRRVAVADAAVAGRPIVAHRPGSIASLAFHRLAEEVQRRVSTPQAV